MTEAWLAPLAGFPVIVQQAVVWGDMDSYQHVNNVVYFRYFENSRLEYFRRLDWFTLEKEIGVGPILATTQARFRRALTYPDTIAIGTRVSEMKEDRFTLEHRIVSQKLGEVATEGQGTIVTFHYGEGKKVAVPEELKRPHRGISVVLTLHPSISCTPHGILPHFPFDFHAECHDHG